jgi:hypothetical protein
MRAILIDPETKTFTEIQIADDIDGIQKVLRCGRFTTGGRPLRGTLLTGFDTLYVSDDSLEDREGRASGFRSTPTAIRHPRIPSLAPAWHTVSIPTEPPATSALASPNFNRASRSRSGNSAASARP